MSTLLRSGPLLMILASAAFTTMVACTRVARAEMDGVDLVFWRGVISLPLLVMAARETGLAVKTHRRALLVRSVLGFLAMSSFYTAALEVDLLTLALVMRLQPILVTVGAPLFLGRAESAGRSAPVAALVGFAGSALVVGPALTAGSWSVLFAVAAVVFSAGAHLALRQVAQENPGPAIVFWFHLIMIPLAVLLLGGQGKSVTLPPVGLLWPVLGVGVFATVGQLLMTRAYRVEKASLVATASYAGVLFSLAYDVFLFGNRPTPWALPGGALVVGASLWLVIRARRRRAIGLVN